MATQFRQGNESPAVLPLYAEAVTPSDTVDLPFFTRALNVGTAGNVQVVMADQSIVVLALSAGIIHPIACRRVMATLTTAVNIVALF